jgi:hypothetical protein
MAWWPQRSTVLDAGPNWRVFVAPWGRPLPIQHGVRDSVCSATGLHLSRLIPLPVITVHRTVPANQRMEPTRKKPRAAYPRPMCAGHVAVLGGGSPCPGVRGAEGQVKRKGVVVRRGLKEAWSACAGRGTRTGYEVWHARDERARHSTVLHPHWGVLDKSGACASMVPRLAPGGLPTVPRRTEEGASIPERHTGVRRRLSRLAAAKRRAERFAGGRGRDRQRG